MTWQAVEKRFQQPAPSLLSLPRRERSLGTKPVFTQGVESEREVIRFFMISQHPAKEPTQTITLIRNPHIGAELHTGGSATERRVHERVADASVLDDEASQTPFEDVTGLLEHSRRRRIPFENRGLQTLEAEFGKRVASSALQRFGRDPLAS